MLVSGLFLTTHSFLPKYYLSGEKQTITWTKASAAPTGPSSLLDKDCLNNEALSSSSWRTWNALKTVTKKKSSLPKWAYKPQVLTTQCRKVCDEGSRGCCEHLLVGTPHSADRVGTETRGGSEMLSKEQGSLALPSSPGNCCSHTPERTGTMSEGLCQLLVAVGLF